MIGIYIRVVILIVDILKSDYLRLDYQVLYPEVVNI